MRWARYFEMSAASSGSRRVRDVDAVTGDGVLGELRIEFGQADEQHREQALAFVFELEETGELCECVGTEDVRVVDHEDALPTVFAHDRELIVELRQEIAAIGVRLVDAELQREATQHVLGIGDTRHDHGHLRFEELFLEPLPDRARKHRLADTGRAREHHQALLLPERAIDAATRVGERGRLDLEARIGLVLERIETQLEVVQMFHEISLGRTHSACGPLPAAPLDEGNALLAFARLGFTVGGLGVALRLRRSLGRGRGRSGCFGRSLRARRCGRSPGSLRRRDHRLLGFGFRDQIVEALVGSATGSAAGSGAIPSPVLRAVSSSAAPGQFGSICFSCESASRAWSMAPAA